MKFEHSTQSKVVVEIDGQQEIEGLMLKGLKSSINLEEGDEAHFEWDIPNRRAVVTVYKNKGWKLEATIDELQKEEDWIASRRRKERLEASRQDTGS